MDSEQWQDCELWLMLPYIKTNASERKQRLLAAAFCRRIARFMTAPRCRHLLKEAVRLAALTDEQLPKSTFLLDSVLQAERCADGLVSPDELAPMCHIADRLSFVREYYYACYSESWGRPDYKLIASSDSAAAVYETLRPSVNVEAAHKRAGIAVSHASGSEEDNTVEPEEEAAQCRLVRDLFPNPLCRVEWNRNWSIPKVVARARAIYDDNAFDELPALARALSRVGCDDPAVLAHCKSREPHVRGCWVVDSILGKT